MAAVPAVALLSDEWEAVVLHLHPKAAMALAITSVHMLVVVGAAIVSNSPMHTTQREHCDSTRTRLQLQPLAMSEHEENVEYRIYREGVTI